MNLISSPIQLHGKLINLIPLEESHFNELILLAKDKRIWEHYVINGGETLTLKTSLENGITEKEHGRQYPFVIVDRKEDKIIGSTRFMDIHKNHNKLEIGWTWLHPDYWGTKINFECKFLLLKYSFEDLSLSRVQLKTDENNKRSSKAIEKIGGQFEGILRNDMIRENGTKRNSAYYSIIDNEWENVKQNLLGKLKDL
jgi:RimJ/RimL family protein N-acetyltransferase